MARAVRLLDVDHHQVRARVALDRTQRDAGLVVHEEAHLVLVHRLELEVGKRAEPGAQPLRDAEVGLRRPEPHVRVDVVDVREHGRVARDRVRRVAGEVDARQIGL